MLPPEIKFDRETFVLSSFLIPRKLESVSSKKRIEGIVDYVKFLIRICRIFVSFF